MVDPSVHRFRMSSQGRDESSDGSELGSAREDSTSSVFKGAARRHVRRSRSRTRRPSGNRAERTNTPQKNRDPKKSTPIEEHSNGDTSSASSSASRASSSSESKGGTSASSSKHSSSDDESTQSSPISSGKSFPAKNTATLSSEDKSMQASKKPTSRGKTFQDNSSATSGSEDESMQTSPGPTSKAKASPDNDSASSCSEDEFMSSPGPTSKEEGHPDNQSATSGSEDESMQASPEPTAKGKASPDNDSATSDSEDEPMSSPGPTSKEEAHPDNQSATSGSEDESMQSPAGPTSKGKASPDNDSASSGSEDAFMQSPPTSKGKAIPDNQSATSGSEDESMQSPAGPTSKGKASPDNDSASSGSEDASMPSSPGLKSRRKLFSDSASSGSEDESIQSSTRPTSKGKSSPDNNSATSSSEDESIQSSNRPTSKGEAVPNTLPASSGSEDESMQPPPGPASKGKALPDTPSASSASEDESAKENKRTETKPLELEEGSPYENAGAKPIEDRFLKEWGDKLTVKFKVSLPEVGNDLIGGPLQFLRVPQFIPVEAGAYHAESFKDSMTPDDLKDEQARGDFLNRLKTTVRWRENQDKVKESNARIVRWSDGTETFHVGAEVFDVMHHKVNDDKNQLYVRLESCYQVQGSITDKMTLRPKLDSTFGQSHVQGLRNRAMNKPQTGLVKVLSDLVSNPMVDREQRAKADLANLRKEDRLKRREIQLSLRKPRVKPMRHCTADDSDAEQPAGELEDKIGRNSTQGIRTNRNATVNPGKVVSTDEEDDEDDYDSDVNDIINDEELDYYDDDDVDEGLSDEPRASTSKPKKTLRRSPKSDDDDLGPKSRTGKRKSKQLVYSDSSSG